MQSSETSDHIKKTFWLTLGQLSGLGVSFIIPFFLSRFLTVEGYGTYKQLLLMHSLFLLTLHLGMDWSLFYFIKRTPSRAALFSINAMAVSTLSALVISAGLVLGKDGVSHALKNPELAFYLPAFVPFLLFSVPSHHFAHYLTILDRIKNAVWLTLFFEIGKTFIILICYYYFRSLSYVLLGLGALAAIRFFILLWFNLNQILKTPITLLSASQNLKEQFQFSLPLAFSNAIQLILKLDRFIVSGIFGVRAFTFYSVGCFELPIVESTSITLADLMSFDMVKANTRSSSENLAAQLWKTTLRRIIFFHVPITAFAIVYAREIITFIYSNTYSDSALYFRIFSIVFLLPSLTPEVLFRVFAKTKLLLKLRAYSLFYALPLLFLGSQLGGPTGVLMGKLTADLVSSALQWRQMGRLLKLPFSQVVPWNELAKVTLLSVFSGSVAYFLTNHLLLSLLLKLGLGFVFYLVLTVPLGLCLGIFPKEDFPKFIQRFQVS